MGSVATGYVPWTSLIEMAAMGASHRGLGDVAWEHADAMRHSFPTTQKEDGFPLPGLRGKRGGVPEAHMACPSTRAALQRLVSTGTCPGMRAVKMGQFTSRHAPPSRANWDARPLPPAPKALPGQPKRRTAVEDGFLFIAPRVRRMDAPAASLDVDAEAALVKASAAVRRAQRLVVFTGAGMSYDAGIATFRGDGGAWTGLKGKVLLCYGATPLGWSLSPRLTWRRFVSHFYAPIAKADPHGGHRALARLERGPFAAESKRMSTVTMNVDGLHQRAGAARVHEVHGAVTRFRCGRCAMPIAVDDVLANAREPPACPTCSRGRARPACTLFGEALPAEAWAEAMADVRSLQPGDAMLVIGTSSVVFPAAGLPTLARAQGATVVEINPEESTPLSSVAHVHVRGGARAVLERLVDLVLDRVQGPVGAAAAAIPA